MKRDNEQQTTGNDFEWWTEEDERWGDGAEPNLEAAPRGQRRWPAVLAVLLVVALAGYSIYYLLSRQVSQAETAVSRDVLASHELVGMAVSQADPELFTLLLSGRDGDWSLAQQAMVQSGAFYDRSSLGLYLDAAVPAKEVVLAPNLLEAQVITDQPYQVRVGSDVTETIVLRQTAVYRLGNDQRWLLAPPDHTFWGARKSSAGPFLTLHYFERDAEIGQRLALDLNTKLGEICRSLAELRCRRGQLMQVYLEADPETLLMLTDTPATLAGTWFMRLPAPSLVGMPIDEAGYRALFRGYAAYMLPALSGWDCCRGGFFYQAIMERQLHQVGLRPWPLTREGYERIHDQPVALADLATYWSELPGSRLDPEVSWVFYAFVEFLLQLAPHHSLTYMQQQMSQAPTLWAWLHQLTGRQLGEPALEQAWLNFVHERAGTGRSADLGVLLGNHFQ
jgi:hypothetical protein